MDTIRTLALVVMTVAASMAFVADSEGQVGSSTGIVNPNLAGETELLALPSINQALVTQIVNQRPFLNLGHKNPAADCRTNPRLGALQSRDR